jgi:hypothetical protein
LAPRPERESITFILFLYFCGRALVEKAFRRGHVALCRQQKVDGLSLLVDSAVEIFGILPVPLSWPKLATF